MDHRDGTVRAIAWQHVFPWLRIYQCLRMALQLRMLVVVAVALALTEFGGNLIEVVFRGDLTPQVRIADTIPTSPKATDVDSIAAMREQLTVRPTTLVGRFVNPAVMLVADDGRERAWPDTAYCAAHTAWLLLVWSIAGCALARAAGLELTVQQPIGVKRMLLFGLERSRAALGAGLLPILGILVLGAGLALAGWVGGFLPEGGLVAVLWPVLAIVGWGMAMLGVGLLLGWPIMAAAVGTEDCDAFDAASRTFSYVFQAPLKYAWYLVFSTVIGLLGLVLVTVFLSLAITMADVGLVAGGANAEMDSSFWMIVAERIPDLFLISFFWNAVTCIYILLRYDVDRAEYDTVGSLEKESPMAPGIRPLPTDSDTPDEAKTELTTGCKPVGSLAIV